MRNGRREAARGSTTAVERIREISDPLAVSALVAGLQADSDVRMRGLYVEALSRHGFGSRWFPLKDLVQGRAELPRMADEVALLIAREPGAVLVHCDRVSEWLAAVDASLRLRLALATDAVEALQQAQADGMPVGDLARSLMQQEDGPPDGGVAVAA